MERIHSFRVFGSRLGLGRMRRMLHLLGDPQDGMNIIHVAGTNGKGSVCRYVYSVLEENGYRTGAYFSPYLERFTERIEFDGKEISREDLVRYAEQALGAAEEMVRRGWESPTEFELVTAIGFLYFAAKNADFVILEVGLGGRGDSTNICSQPAVTAIVSISYDHMAQLGNTLPEIAAEKAGIIKKGVPVVVCVEDPDAFEVIRKRAEELSAPLIDASRVRISTVRESLEGCIFDAMPDEELRAQLSGMMQWQNIEISMCGHHQISNAVCALLMIEVLRKRGIRIEEERLHRGMKKAVQKGRFEIMRKNPYLILDGAHNPAGARALKETVRRFFGGDRILLCTGILADKAYREIVGEWSQLDADVLVTEVPNPRKMDAAALAGVFAETEPYRSGRRSIAVIADYEEAFAYAERKKQDYDLILWAGSLYLIGGVRRMITCVE